MCRPRGLGLDPFVMCENLKCIASSHSDERDPGGPSGANGKSGRRGNRHENGRPHMGGFLHQFDRNAARQNDDAAARAETAPRHGAGQFVEGVVAPDILAQPQ